VQFRAELLEIKLKEVFRTSRGEADRKVVCAVSFVDALGECCPSLHYGYSAEDCNKAIETMQLDLATKPFDLDQSLDFVHRECGERSSLAAGLDIALHDYWSRQVELPLWSRLGLPNPSGRETSYTISIDRPSATEARLKAASNFRILKLKLGSENDQDNLAILGHLQGRTIRVDANGAFELSNIEWLIRAAHDLKLELIEEPLKSPKLSDLRDMQSELRCPVVMDESVKCIDDVERFKGVVGGINIKLQKVGGIRRALEMIRSARGAGMKIMVGCMLETSVGISASANLAGLADYIDLDSIELIGDDPFAGVELKDGRLVMPNRPGHGAVRRSRQ
jgi:L-alanine-DL-glutamate epimerase-like enolase superfamily enzyme